MGESNNAWIYKVNYGVVISYMKYKNIKFLQLFHFLFFFIFFLIKFLGNC